MKKIVIGIIITVVVVSGVAYYLFWSALINDPFVTVYDDTCAGCHGEEMLGTDDAGPLVGGAFQLGVGVKHLENAIASHPDVPHLPLEVRTLTDAQARGLAILIGETQTARTYRTFEVEEPLGIPDGVVESEHYNFRVEVVTDELDALPFSIAPLPQGGFLVTEKQKGLRTVSVDGLVSDYISGAPEVFDDSVELLLPWGYGWMLDVALHPEYVENGWVYLHYTDRCMDCPDISGMSRNTVIRGRVRDGQWVDEELIWQPDESFYSRVPDIGAGGRLAFDDQGHLFISVGLKGTTNFDHIQDLSKPAGKIHRVHLDGSVPLDNPFLTVPGAYASTWTYGHRSPQGLEFNRATGQLWQSEMGPRGGDELNLLLPGKNYGWPLTSHGIDYDGSHVEYGKELNQEFDLADIQQPEIDLTPGPAVSSFAFYEGTPFSAWQGHMLVGSLAARELYRIDPVTKHTEKLLSDIGRIRDVEVGPEGAVYLLLEHPSGGRIVRLVPSS